MRGIGTDFLSSHQAILYDRPLEARFFNPPQRLAIEHERYRCELWVMPGAHAVLFDCGPLCATELLTDQEFGLPDVGVLSAFLCQGERDYEHTFEQAGVEYLTTVQAECVSLNVYDGLLDETRAEVSRQRHTLLYEWQSASGPCLSAVLVEPLAREVRIEAFHILASGGLVLRSGSVFEHP